MFQSCHPYSWKDTEVSESGLQLKAYSPQMSTSFLKAIANAYIDLVNLFKASAAGFDVPKIADFYAEEPTSTGFPGVWAAHEGT